MPQPMDHYHPVDPERQCEGKVKNSYRRCKKPAIVDRHFCAYHSGLAGPRFDPCVTLLRKPQELRRTAQVGEDICQRHV